jgi:hypothetical protein
MSKKSKAEVDYKLLSERLQEALATEIREGQEKDDTIEEQEEAIAGLVMLVHYFEAKLGIYGNKSI